MPCRRRRLQRWRCLILVAECPGTPRPSTVAAGLQRRPTAWKPPGSGEGTSGTGGQPSAAASSGSSRGAGRLGARPRGPRVPGGQRQNRSTSPSSLLLFSFMHTFFCLGRHHHPHNPLSASLSVFQSPLSRASGRCPRRARTRPDDPSRRLPSANLSMVLLP
ncbi:hypothetical protein CDD83_7255 [Cordyceps sp. RAO-2017]|nr:hypothetical protein CDD83_7255 [Cordyceps sp. RAO-2017]